MVAPRCRRLQTVGAPPPRAPRAWGCSRCPWLPVGGWAGMVWVAVGAGWGEGANLTPTLFGEEEIQMCVTDKKEKSAKRDVY